MVNMNGRRVAERRGNTLFIPLPRELWRPIEDSKCMCGYCTKHPDVPPYWDTLAVAQDPGTKRNDTTWVVHAPEIARRGES